MKFTEWLGVYGAVVSTATAWWNYHRSRPSVRVRIILDTEGAVISVQNPSAHPVHLSHVGLLYPWKRKVTVWGRVKHVVRYRSLPRTIGWVHTSLQFYGVEDGCPVTIESGKSHDVTFPHKAVEELLAHAASRWFRASAQDQLWRNKYSAPFEYPLPPNREGDP